MESRGWALEVRGLGLRHIAMGGPPVRLPSSRFERMQTASLFTPQPGVSRAGEWTGRSLLARGSSADRDGPSPAWWPCLPSRSRSGPRPHAGRRRDRPTRRAMTRRSSPGPVCQRAMRNGSGTPSRRAPNVCCRGSARRPPRPGAMAELLLCLFPTDRGGRGSSGQGYLALLDSH